MMLVFLPGSLGFNASVFFSLHLSRFLNAFSPGLGAGSVHSSVEAQEETASVLTSLTAGSAGASEVTSSYRAQFTVPPGADVGAPLLPNVKDPDAVDPQLVCPGYSASNVIRTDAGLTATLKLAGKACNVYGTDIEFLNLTVEYQSADRLSVQIMPAHIDASNATQYFLPQGPVLDPIVDPDAGSSSLANDLRFVWSNDPTFSFSIYRKSTGDTVFSTAGSKIVFENQFLEFASPLPENYNLYGLGETIHSFRLGNNYTKTMYNADTGDPIDDNIYGSHPVYLDTRYYKVGSGGDLTLVKTNGTEAGSSYLSFSHGVYNRNAHGQEILLRPTNITWRTLGGGIDLYFYAGPTPDLVISAYQRSATGLPALQQYFTLGYHQCRWGYTSWSALQDVVSSFERFQIPLETIWADIDYMNQYRDFDQDENTFPYEEGERFISDLHRGGRHYVPIIDSAIYVPNPSDASDSYEPFDRGNAAASFLTNPDGSLYIGAVWPGYTAFPDWLSPNAGSWWVNEIVRYYKKLAIDGIWIDMSEVASFCVGSCGSRNVSMNPVHPPFALPGESSNAIYSYPEGFNNTNGTEAAVAAFASSSQAAVLATSANANDKPTSTSYLRTTVTPWVRNVNHPPYVINHVHGDLAVHAVSPNATHADGTEEYDVHNLWGTQILNATYSGLLAAMPNKRPFIIGRSTFTGSGRWAGHWGGDNASLWAHMYFSISQALQFALFGIPMFGVDTCGFAGNSAEELCNRWMQLSAFFPFYRNHNAIGAISQEPYVWSSVIDASKKAMAIRYQLLPYMYTLFYLAHHTGSTVMRALAWEFPHDPSLAAIETQFFLGPAILVIPVLAQGATTAHGVFPGAGKGQVYYDWYTHGAVMASAGENVTIPAPLGHIPVYIRGGHVIPTQEVALTTRDARKSPWSVLVALGLQGTASGQLYIDDGESVVQDSTLYIELSASPGTLSTSGRGRYVDQNPLDRVTVLGVEKPARGVVTLNGNVINKQDISYDEGNKSLTVAGLKRLTPNGAWAQDWVLKWT